MVNLKIITILFVSGYLSLYKSQEDQGEGIFEKIKSHKIKSLQEIEILKNTTDMTYLIFLYKKSSKISRLIAPQLMILGNKLDYIAELILVDCDEINFINDTVCEHKNQTQDQFPRMKVLVPPEFRLNPYTKKMNQYYEIPFEGKEVSESILFNFITKYVNSHAIKLSTSNLDNFLR